MDSAEDVATAVPLAEALVVAGLAAGDSAVAEVVVEETVAGR